jgi:hypothetical protein
VLSGVLPQALKQKTLERIVHIISHDFARSMLIVYNKISVFRDDSVCINHTNVLDKVFL